MLDLVGKTSFLHGKTQFISQDVLPDRIDPGQESISEVCMAKINYVATCAAPEAGGFNTLLDIHFDNGQTLLLSFKAKQDNSAFVKLYQKGELNRPKTDGDSVYWEDGTRLSIPEIMEMARGM